MPKNTSFVSILLALLILSCISALQFESPSVAAQNPFDLATPTPTPTAPPQPTPTPTPKPEPKIWPTLDLKIISSAQASSLKTQVSGTLSYNHTAIPDASIYVGYSVDQGVTWKNFSLVQTHSDGSYAAVWLPNASGAYLVNAHWEGNQTLHWLDASAYLALTSDSLGNEFSAVSNSSLSGFAYNQSRQTLSFSVNVTSGSVGYVYVGFPKNMLGDTHVLSFDVDGQAASFASESQDDVWVVSAVFGEGSHDFRVQIPKLDVIVSDSLPLMPIIVVVAVVALIVVVAVVLAVRRRRRTAATVAAILKENRPQF